MSGHSKWANIKHKKQANDKVRGLAFSKLSRVITLAVIEGGGMTDPAHNFKLRLIIEKARALNMPKENIARAIEKGSGPNKALLKEVVYEGFAPHGISLIIEASSDNPTRTYSEVRNCLEQHGGKLGSQGSVSYLFEKCGMIKFDKDKVKEEDTLAFAEGMGASDIDSDEETYTVYFPFGNLGKVKDHIGALPSHPAEVDYKAQSLISIPVENIKSVIAAIDALEALDDVHTVFSNIDIPDAFTL